MAREDIVEGQAIHCWYDSLDEFADAAVRRDGMGSGPAQNVGNASRHSWAGGTFADALDAARIGWEAKLDETLEIMEHAITMVEKDHEVKAFVPTWEVTGAEVDVARYLEGIPENMIDFPMQEVSKLGKVITLCASIAASCAVSADALIKRGQVLAAFAMMITKLGYSAELWIDQTVNKGDYKFSQKVMVKGPNDTVDPARIVAAYAHPGMLRRLTFSVENGLPPTWYKRACGDFRGYPHRPIPNLPEGTIYLPELKSGRDVPDADVMLLDLLRQAGLIAE